MKRVSMNPKFVIVWLVLMLSLLFATVTCAMAEGEEDGQDEIVDYVNAEEYTTGYFEGAISDSVSTHVNVRYGPGSDKYEIMKTSAGKSVQLTAGTPVSVVGETKDSALDVWYHIRFEFEGEQIDGYCFADFISKGDKVLFSPTPTPSPTETPSPTPTLPEDAPIVFNPTATPSPETQDMLDKSDGLGPMLYILILFVVVLVFIVIYTIVTKVQEERLEKEMERYSNRGSFQKLDEESDEDFLEAKKVYFDSLNLGDGEKRVDAGDDEIELDLNGIFDETSVYVTDEDIDSKAFDAAQTAEELEDEAEEALEEVSEELSEELAQFDDWNVETQDFLAEGEAVEAEQTYDRIGEELAENIASEVEAVSEAAPVVAVASDATALLEKLNQLKEQDTLYHKLYGEGEIIDNSDSEVIQVRFGRDLRFLKKEKLAKKELVELD